MSDVVIRVENLSKHYRLGTIGGATLREDMQRWWAQLRGKPDPLAPLDGQGRPDGTDHWALRDVSFEVKRGEVLGVIGRNGAGKSTLLKILSRTTAPTSGRAMVKGRIGSLLEVGTGFHPELTGRENIYLNGSILGMRKAEIDRKIDEIIEFSGVDRFIDTPVKRYSSGMYVRLAFAVAAHLEPEILIVDEVLAVGDAEFQSKCLGKMHEVSSSGRTVLFVSHNLSAIRAICSDGMVLADGSLIQKASVEVATSFYQSRDIKGEDTASWAGNNRPGDAFLRLDAVSVKQLESAQADANQGAGFSVCVEFTSSRQRRDLDLGINITNAQGELVVHTTLSAHSRLPEFSAGRHKVVFRLPSGLLGSSRYAVSIGAVIPNQAHIFDLRDVLSFEVPEYRTQAESFYPSDSWRGALGPLVGTWAIHRIA